MLASFFVLRFHGPQLHLGQYAALLTSQFVLHSAYNFYRAVSSDVVGKSVKERATAPKGIVYSFLVTVL